MGGLKVSELEYLSLKSPANKGEGGRGARGRKKGRRKKKEGKVGPGGRVLCLACSKELDWKSKRDARKKANKEGEKHSVKCS